MLRRCFNLGLLLCIGVSAFASIEKKPVKIRNWLAYQVDYKGFHGIFLKPGRAKTWDEARSLCRSFESESAPRGAWDLPDPTEYVVAAALGIPEFSLPAASYHGPESRRDYPMWVRGRTEEQSRELFAGRALTLYVPQGEDGNIAFLDLSPQGAAETREMMQIISTGPHPDPKKRRKLEVILKLHQAGRGLDVYCVRATREP